MPQVSIIIATHNRPHLLPRAVKSAGAAGKDVEIVVVDDASEAETFRVCQKFSGIRYVRVERNRRLGGARNLGILASVGELISFLDDDDVRLPHSLDAQIEALASAPEAGFVYGQALHGDQNGAPLGSFYPAACPQGDVFWELLKWNFVPCPTVVFRRDCLHRVGLLDEAMPGVEDWDLWIRIAELYPVVAVERPVAVWRRSTPDSGQYTSRHAEMLCLCARLLRERWLALPRAAGASPAQLSSVRRQFAEHVAEQLAWEAARALQSAQPGHAMKQVSAAARLTPWGFARRAMRLLTMRIFSGRGRRSAVAADDGLHLPHGRPGRHES